jgi:hypothetical protein
MTLIYRISEQLQLESKGSLRADFAKLWVEARLRL